MSFEEHRSTDARPENTFQPVSYRFRYLRGVVGESQRVVHLAVFADEDSVWSLCHREFGLGDVEQVERCGMPCLPCTGRAATAAAGFSPALQSGVLPAEGSDPR